MIIRMKYLVVIALIFFIAFTGSTSVRGQPSDFALTFNCGKDLHKLCLIGEITPGKSVTLLSSGNSKICTAHTGDSFMHYFEPGSKDIPSTHLKLDKCQDPGQYFLAYFGTGRLKYQLLELSLFEDESKIRDFDRIVKKQKLLEVEASAQSYPKVFKLPLSRKDIFIGQYETEGRGGYGPLFMSVRGRVEKIHFLASVYRAFRLNGHLYLMFNWRSGEEGSGSQGAALVELTESGFKLIFEDDSWST